MAPWSWAFLRSSNSWPRVGWACCLCSPMDQAQPESKQVIMPTVAVKVPNCNVFRFMLRVVSIFRNDSEHETKDIAIRDLDRNRWHYHLLALRLLGFAIDIQTGLLILVPVLVEIHHHQPRVVIAKL